MAKPVWEAIRGDGGRKELAMAEARQALDTAYSWLEDRLEDRMWAAGEDFSMADCAGVRVSQPHRA
ncbi:MAG: glutathione S-transferase C-terminal domain-containing protein [Pseudomonadota bacterium]|nr:glutathione S-transferase C-terminal domain-containing protein [Pseudomonadota bacterium]